LKTILTAALLLVGLPTISELDAPDEAVEVSGTLLLTPVVSRTTDSPSFEVTFTSDAPAPFTVTRIQPRSGILLDGVEYHRNIYRWAGIVNTIEPGDVYKFRFSLGEFLPGAQRRNYSKTLRRWRWHVPLSSGAHRVVFFLRRHSSNDTERATSNEVAFVWDDSQPLLYD